VSERRYQPSEIEPRWQALWESERTWEVANLSGEQLVQALPKSYVLEMLPYPSGDPHIGHLKNYAVGDAVAHFRRRTGHRVLHPLGYDAFGLPAENNAIKTGIPPREATEASIASFQRTFRRWGLSIDWTREISSHEPEYYRWTQWIFLKLYERGLAYRKESAVNWCPHDQTVLANEQVVDGRCERCGHEVELRQLEQWKNHCSSWRSSSSGSSPSPSTPIGCSTTSTQSTGPRRSRHSSATGSADRPAPR
jgi:leucyl-tRNA synthetase